MRKCFPRKFFNNAIFVVVTLLFVSELCAAPVERITREGLLAALERVEARIIDANTRNGKETPTTHREFPFWRALPRPLLNVQIDSFFVLLLQELKAGESSLYIEDSFLKLLLELRPYLLNDLHYSEYLGRHVYNPTGSKRVYWKKYKFEHYFSDFIHSDLMNPTNLRIVSAFYPAEKVYVEGAYRIIYEAPFWWKEVVELYVRALDEGRTYGEFFDELYSLLLAKKVEISAPFIRTKIAPALGLNRKEDSMILATLLQSFMSAEHGRVFVCAGPICKMNAGDMSPGRAVAQLKSIGINAEISPMCHEGCRAGRHLNGQGFPKITGAHMPGGVAPGVVDVLTHPGLFAPPGSLCRDLIRQVRSAKLH